MPIGKQSGPVAGLVGAAIRGPKTKEESQKPKKVKLYTPEAAEKAQMQPASKAGKNIVAGYREQNQRDILTTRLAQKAGTKAQMSAKRSPKTYKGRDIPSDKDIKRMHELHKDYEEAGTFKPGPTPSEKDVHDLKRHASAALNVNNSMRERKRGATRFHDLEKVAGVSPDIKMRPCANRGCTNPVSFEHEDVSCATCKQQKIGEETRKNNLAGLNRSRR